MTRAAHGHSLGNPLALAGLVEAAVWAGDRTLTAQETRIELVSALRDGGPQDSD